MGTHPIFESDFDCLTDLWKKYEYLPACRRYEPLAGHIAADCQDLEIEISRRPLGQISDSIHCRLPDSLSRSLLELCLRLQYHHENGLHHLLRRHVLLHLPKIQGHSQSR